MTQSESKHDQEQEAGAAPEGAAAEAEPRHEEGAPEPTEPDAAEAAAPEAEPAPPGAELQAELEETRDRLLRTLAEMENLRRRTQREVEDARRYAISAFARDLLDVADNLSRALASIPPKAREKIDLVKNLAEGVEMTQKTLRGVFERHQIAKVEPEPGERFDHNLHQAMFEVTSDQPPGTVAQVLQPGYTIADRLLRPALVGVAKPAAGGPADDAAGGDDGAAEEPGDPQAANDSRPGGRVDTTA